MAKRQPEGLLKDECRDEHARPNGLLFYQVEGKSCRGFPDTVASKTTGGVIFIEFKIKGRQPEDQQWLRIYELREQGIEAWWCDSVEGYRKLVRLDQGGYAVEYPEKAKRQIRLMYGQDAL